MADQLWQAALSCFQLTKDSIRRDNGSRRRKGEQGRKDPQAVYEGPRERCTESQQGQENHHLPPNQSIHLLHYKGWLVSVGCLVESDTKRGTIAI